MSPARPSRQYLIETAGAKAARSFTLAFLPGDSDVFTRPKTNQISAGLHLSEPGAIATGFFYTAALLLRGILPNATFPQSNPMNTLYYRKMSEPGAIATGFPWVDLVYLDRRTDKVSELLQAFRSFIGESQMMAYLVMMAVRLNLGSMKAAEGRTAWWSDLFAKMREISYLHSR